jgi:hypothetical protein
MLKITYSDAAILLEQVATTVEAVMAQRSLLALRSGQPFTVQPSSGSIVLPAQLPGINGILDAVDQHTHLSIAPCDLGWLEITLRGTWIAESAASEQGILVAELGDDLEGRLVTLWRCSLTWAAAPQALPKAC